MPGPVGGRRASPATVAIRRNNWRAASCSPAELAVQIDSARRATALRTPPIRSYVARSSTGPFAFVEELRERVLEERQRVRLSGHVGDETADEPRLDGDVELAGRQGRSGLELIGAQRDDADDVVGEQLSQLRIGQRPIVEVGAQRDEDVHRAVRGSSGRFGQGGEEPRGLARIDREREELLELVDDQQQSGCRLRAPTSVASMRPVSVAASSTRRDDRSDAGKLAEGRFEHGEGLRARLHRRDRRSGMVASQLCDQPRLDHARLARAARPDERGEASTVHVTRSTSFPTSRSWPKNAPDRTRGRRASPRYGFSTHRLSGGRPGGRRRDRGPGPGAGSAPRAGAVAATGRCRGHRRATSRVALERAQRIGLPAGSVQGDHVERPELLAVRVLRVSRSRSRTRLTPCRPAASRARHQLLEHDEP